MDYNFLTQTVLFKGMSAADTENALKEMKAVTVFYKKGNTILNAGVPVTKLGIIAEGSVCIDFIDFWGRKNILNRFGKGQIFGEVYACAPEEPLMVNAVAADDCRIIFIEATRLIEYGSGGKPQLLQNLLSVMANKNLVLSRRMLHTAPKTIREKMLAYLAYMQLRSGSCEVTLPFNRQKLASYLNVDRSALSAEISKMKKDGLIAVHKNKFVILRH